MTNSTESLADLMTQANAYLITRDAKKAATKVCLRSAQQGAYGAADAKRWLSLLGAAVVAGVVLAITVAF